MSKISILLNQHAYDLTGNRLVELAKSEKTSADSEAEGQLAVNADWDGLATFAPVIAEKMSDRLQPRLTQC